MDFNKRIRDGLVTAIQKLSTKKIYLVKLAMLRGSKLNETYPLHKIHVDWLEKTTPLKLSLSIPSVLCLSGDKTRKLKTSSSFNETDAPLLLIDNNEIVNYLTYYEMEIFSKIFPTEILADIKWQAGFLSPNINQLVKNFNQVVKKGVLSTFDTYDRLVFGWPPKY